MPHSGTAKAAFLFHLCIHTPIFRSSVYLAPSLSQSLCVFLSSSLSSLPVSSPLPPLSLLSSPLSPLSLLSSPLPSLSVPPYLPTID